MRALVSLLLWLIPFAPLQQESKTPAPDAAAQKEAEKEIRDVFKEEYAKRGAPERLALARKLLDQGLQTKDKANSRFVLFREAQELAAQAGNIEVAFRAIRELSSEFQVDATAMKNQALAAAMQNAKAPEEFKALAEASIVNAEEAIAADEFDGAAKALNSASTLAKKAKEMALISRIDAKSKEAADLKSKFDKVQKARETLAAKPDDAPAAQTVGWYHCAAKGDWEKGLPLLAQGTDAGLKALASLDLSRPTQPAEMAALGDKWWEKAEKLRGSERDAVRNRAVFWYEQSLAGLGGLAKAKVEKRLADLRSERLSKEGWVDFTDPSLFGWPGRKGDPIQFLETTKQNTWLKMAKFPAGEFDTLSLRLTFESPDMQGQVRIELEGVLHEVMITKDFFSSHSRGDPLGQFAVDFSARLTPKREVVLSGSYQSGEIVFFMDGKELGRSKTTQKMLTSLALTAYAGKIKFDDIRLKRNR